MAWNIPTFSFESLLPALKLNILQANFDALFKSDTSKAFPLSTMMDRGFTEGSQYIAFQATWYPAIGAYMLVTTTSIVSYYEDRYMSTIAYTGGMGLIITDGNYFILRTGSGGDTFYYHKLAPNSGAVTATWTDPVWSVGEVPVSSIKIEQIFENFEAASEGYSAGGPQLLNFDADNSTSGSVAQADNTRWVPASGVYCIINVYGHMSLYVSGAWRNSSSTNLSSHFNWGTLVCDGSNQGLVQRYGPLNPFYYIKYP